MMNAINELKHLEASRSQVYRRLADTYRLPSLQTGEELETLAFALTALGSEAADEAVRLKTCYDAMPGKRVLDVEYARLFMGPFVVPAPPYGSIYIENKRRLMGDSTIDVRQHYLSLGLDVSPDFKEAPDHIVAELEFMHVLIVQAVEAIDALDGRALSDNIRQQRTFLEQHLGVWAPLFAARVSEHTHADYYRHLASLSRIFIAEDLAALQDQAARQAAAKIQN